MVVRRADCITRVVVGTYHCNSVVRAELDVYHFIIISEFDMYAHIICLWWMDLFSFGPVGRPWSAAASGIPRYRYTPALSAGRASFSWLYFHRRPTAAPTAKWSARQRDGGVPIVLMLYIDNYIIIFFELETIPNRLYAILLM